jgi:hypothetical protein
LVPLLKSGNDFLNARRSFCFFVDLEYNPPFALSVGSLVDSTDDSGVLFSLPGQSLNRDSSSGRGSEARKVIIVCLLWYRET